MGRPEFYGKIFAASIGAFGMIIASFITAYLSPKTVINISEAITDITPTAKVIEVASEVEVEVEVTHEVEVEVEVTREVKVEVEVTREVEVEVEATREVEVTREVEATREVEVTHEVIVTATPLPSPSLTPTPENTPPESILLLGETWSYNDRELTLTEVELVPSNNWVYLSFRLRNNTGSSFIFQWSSDNFTLTSNTGEVFRKTSAGKNKDLEPSESSGIRFHYRGEIVSSQVTELIVLVREVAGIENARWRIPVMH